MSIYSKILIAIVWLIAVICCIIMKKIQPETFRLYAVYVFIVCVVFTTVSYILVFLG